MKFIRELLEVNMAPTVADDYLYEDIIANVLRRFEHDNDKLRALADLGTKNFFA